MNKLICLVLTTLLLHQANACSAISVNVYQGSNIRNVIGARSFDFEPATIAPMVFGKFGTWNMSNVNAYPNIGKVMQWQNRFQFIGLPMTAQGNVLDGVNDQGVYVGALYLPGKTQYPDYDSSNPKPAISVYDLANYILGTFSSVNEVVQALKGPQSLVQVVNSALILIDHKTTVIKNSFPIHYIIEDKSGDRAIIEFTGGKMEIYHSKEYAALTNSPTFPWQLHNYNVSADKFRQKNTDYEADGIYQNGSGYRGLPGDTMPISRFVRAYALLHAAPKAYTDNQAYYVAKSVINSLKVGLGVNPGVTIWTSTFNLETGDYFVDFDIAAAANNQILLTNQAPWEHMNATQHINIKSITPTQVEALINSKKLFSARLEAAKQVEQTIPPLSPTSSETVYDNVKFK